MDKPNETVTNFIVFMAAPEFLIARALLSKDLDRWKAICLFFIGVVVLGGCRSPSEPTIPAEPVTPQSINDPFASTGGTPAASTPNPTTTSDARSANADTEPSSYAVPPTPPTWAACTTLGEWTVDGVGSVASFEANGAFTIDATEDDDDRALQWYREGLLTYFSADAAWSCGILEGAYAVTFNDECTALRLGLQHDECAARSAALNNIELTRTE